MSLFTVGMTVKDFHDITFGMAMNMLWEKHRSIARASGEQSSDPEKQYRIMKANLPALEELYREGRVSEEKYKAYIRKLEEWESED